MYISSFIYTVYSPSGKSVSLNPCTILSIFGITIISISLVLPVGMCVTVNFVVPYCFAINMFPSICKTSVFAISILKLVGLSSIKSIFKL